MNTTSEKMGNHGFFRSMEVTSEIVRLLERISRPDDSGGSVPRLLYAVTCPKCRFLSACVTVLSFARIRRIPLDRPEWQEFYAGLPEAKGYPVLIVNNRMIFGAGVFLHVPLLLIRSWFR